MRLAYQRLKEMAQDGRLRRLCDEHGVDLLVGFGSAIRNTGRPAGDVDLAYRFKSSRNVDLQTVLEFVAVITAAASTEQIDFMDLSRAHPVAREQALAYGEVLVENRKGDFAREQVAAINARMDTEWIREIQRKQLAEWP